MALVTCKECGKQISDTSKICPHCGAPKSESIGFTSNQVSRGYFGGIFLIIIAIVIAVIPFQLASPKDFTGFYLLSAILLIVGITSISRSSKAKLKN